MCRVAVRAPTRAREQQQEAQQPLYDVPAGEALVPQPLSFADLFSGEGALDGFDEGDLDLLKLFNASTEEPPADGLPPSAEASAAVPSSPPEQTAVLGQPVGAAAYGQEASVQLDAIHQLQMQALMAQQQQQAAAALMAQPGFGMPGAAGQAILYQQALMQQVMEAQAMPAAAYTAGTGTTAATAPMSADPSSHTGHGLGHGKRHKTQAEIEDQIERTKKRRRESAQRSRQRKNCYMRSLEIENEALKLEVSRLRAELTKQQVTSSLPSGRAASDSSSKPAAHIAAGQPLLFPLNTSSSGDPQSAGYCHADQNGLGEPVGANLLRFAL